MINVLIPLMVALESADGFFTHSAVGKNLVREGNPLMQNIAGNSSFLLLKIVGALLSALLLWIIYRRFPRASLAAATGVVVFYTAVLTWNLSIFF